MTSVKPSLVENGSSIKLDLGAPGTLLRHFFLGHQLALPSTRRDTICLDSRSLRANCPHHDCGYMIRLVVGGQPRMRMLACKGYEVLL